MRKIWLIGLGFILASLLYNFIAWPTNKVQAADPPNCKNNDYLNIKSADFKIGAKDGKDGYLIFHAVLKSGDECLNYNQRLGTKHGFYTYRVNGTSTVKYQGREDTLEAWVSYTGNREGYFDDVHLVTSSGDNDGTWPNYTVDINHDTTIAGYFTAEAYSAIRGSKVSGFKQDSGTGDKISCPNPIASPTDKISTVDKARSALGRPDQTIFIKESSSGNKCPPIAQLKDAGQHQFVLRSVLLTGGQIGNENYVVWFQSLKYADLWLLIDEDADGLILVIDQPAPKWNDNLGVYGNLATSAIENAGGIALSADNGQFNQKVLFRIFNICLNDDTTNCQSGKLAQVTQYNCDTSPASASCDTKQEAYGSGHNYKRPPNDAIASTANKYMVDNNGKPLNTNAWLDVWGASYNDQRGAGDVIGDCSLAGIFKGGAGISDIFKRFTDCLIESIFKPTITWAAQLVGEAAGISSVPRTSNLSLSLKPAAISSLLVDRAYAQAKNKDSDPLKKNLANYIPDKDGFVYKTWRVTIGLVNIVLVVALLVISFSNITRFNFSSYEVKKALPNLFIGILLANASFFLVRFLVDIATAATMLFVNDLNHSGSIAAFFADVTGALTQRTINTIGTGAEIASIIIVPVLMIVTVVLLLWLAFLLYFRLVAVYLLTILAPIAFVAYGIPGAEGYFKQWWQQFTKWLFMVPAMAAVFYLMLAIHKSTSASAGLKQQDSIAQLLIMYVLFFIACTIPTRFGGKVMNDVSGFFRKYSGVGLAQKKMGESYQDTQQRVGKRARIIFNQTPIGKSLQGIAARRKLEMDNLDKELGIQAQEAEAGAREKSKLMRKRAGSEAAFAERGQTAEDRLADLKARSAAEYFRSAKGQEQVKAAIRAELKKRTAEADRDNVRLETKIKLMSDKENKPDKEMVKQLYQKLFNQKRSGDHLELEESIQIGNVALERIQPLQLLENYGKHEKEEERLQKELEQVKDATSPEDIARRNSISARLAELQQAMASQQRDYETMQKKDEYKNEFGSVNFKEALKEFDEGKTDRARLWKATHGRGRKIFNEGITKQNEILIKEGTAAEIKDELNTVKDKILEEFGEQEGQELMKMLFQGRTADFQMKLDQRKTERGDDFKGPGIRDVLLATQLQKQAMSMTGDYRNQDIVTHFVQMNNEINPEQNIQLDGIDMSRREGRAQVVRQATNNVGAIYGSPNARLHLGVGPEPPVSQPSSPPPPRPQPEPEMFREDVGASVDPDVSQQLYGNLPSRADYERYRQDYRNQHGFFPEEYEKKFPNQGATATTAEDEEEAYGADNETAEEEE